MASSAFSGTACSTLIPGNEVVGLYEAELEIIAAGKYYRLASLLYRRSHDAVSESGVEMLTRSKNSAAVDALKLRNAG
jgi:hypothetical protein